MRARTARGASRCRARGGHKMLQRAAAAQAAMVAPTQRIGAFAGGGVARDAEDGVVMSRRRQRRDGEALVRRAARAGVLLARHLSILGKGAVARSALPKGGGRQADA